MQKIILYIIFIAFFFPSLQAQKTVSMEEAISIALENYPQLKIQDSYTAQQKALRESASGHPTMQIGYGWEEINMLDARQGVHNLYVQPTWNMPKVAKTKRAAQDQLAKGSEQQKELTAWQVECAVAKQYQQLVYLKNQQQLNEKLFRIYENSEELARKRMEAGETGELPLLATQVDLKRLKMQILNTNQQIPNQLIQLQYWLFDEEVSDISDSILTEILLDTISASPTNHPSVVILEQKAKTAIAQTEVIKSQLSPQIFSTLQLQAVDSQFPLWGWQIGLNVPVFNKGIKAQVEANDHNRKMAQQQAEWQQSKLELKRKSVVLQVQQTREQLQLLQQDLLPTVQRQAELSLRTYELGEGDYSDYLIHAAELMQLHYQELDLLLRLNLQIIDSKFLLD